MGRPPRIHFKGAFYHVMGRGNAGQALFVDVATNRRFLALLATGAKRLGMRIHAYCLMTNHYHLLVEVDDAPLSQLMHVVQSRFARYRHWRTKGDGHVFQGRYHAILCKDDAYLLTVLRYIHLNPVRARLVDRAREWPWSSHNAYLAHEKTFVTTSFCLGFFTGRSPLGRYESFINATAPAYWPHDLSRRWGAPCHVDDGGQVQADRVALDLAGLLKRISTEAGISPELVAGPSRARDLVRVRRRFVKDASRAGFRLADMARIINRTPSRLARLRR